MSIISELNLSESEEQAVSKISSELQQQGASFQDQDTQKAFLDNLINVGFDLNKVDVAQIAQKSKTIQEDTIYESDGVSLHALVDSEETAHAVEKIIHWMEETFGKKIDSQKVKANLKKLKNVLSFIPNLIQKGFFNLARLFGASVENAKIFGMVGINAFMVFCLVVAAIYLPAAIGVAGSIAGFGILLTKMFKIKTTIKSIWNGIKNLNKEYADKIATPTDLLQAFEDKFKSMDKTQFPMIFEIPHDFVKEVDEWYNHLKGENKKDADRIINQTIKALKSDKSLGGYIEVLEKKHFPASILKKLSAALTTTKQKIDSDEYYQGPLGEVRKIVRDILNEEFKLKKK
jgi:hypothetical protein